MPTSLPINTSPKTQGHLQVTLERLRRQLPTAAADMSLVTSPSNSVLVVGDVVYAPAANQVDKAIATGLVTSRIVGVATAASGIGADSQIQVTGVVENPTWTLTTNSLYYLSDTTAGAIVLAPNETVGNAIAVVGVAVSATKLLLLPNPPFLL